MMVLSGISQRLLKSCVNVANGRGKTFNCCNAEREAHKCRYVFFCYFSFAPKEK